jgi:hypothetical protein
MSKKYYAPVDPEKDLELPADPEALELPPVAETLAKLEPAKSLEATPIKEYLALRVFATLAGPKWDQMAGFVSHARRMKLGPLTMEDWQAEFKKFQEKPVG